MSGELVPSLDFPVGGNDKTAGWLNNQQERMEKGTKLLLDTALKMGRVLAQLQEQMQIGNSFQFAKWVNENLSFTDRAARNYISLYNHRKDISGAENLSEAYKMIETLEAQKKQSETANAYERVTEYRKTGKKPEGWRRGTDDKLAKEAEERDARVEAVKRDALAQNRERVKQAEEKEREKAETAEILDLVGKSAGELQKRAEFKEKIRLSADGMKDPFQDAIIDYLQGLADDNRRIEACQNIIKICRRIAVELQTQRKEA